MATLIPVGFAHILLPVWHVELTRRAAVTFGIAADLGDATPVEYLDYVVGSYVGTIGQLTDAGVGIGPATGRFGQDGGEPLSVEGTFQGAGDRTMDSLPPNVSALVKKSSNRGGRRGRGRMYLPWALADADVGDTGVIGTTPLGNLQTEVSNFWQALEDGISPVETAAMYLLHDSEGSTPAGSPNKVTALTLQSVIATQRRRVRG